MDKFTAFYKIDYGPNTAIALTKDQNFADDILAKTAGYRDFVTTETQFRAIENGNPLLGGKFDNIHTAHPRDLSPPSFADDAGTVFVPGCRLTKFDCAHMHWRWSQSKLLAHVDVMVDPSDLKEPPTQIDETLRGTPYLVPDQTIDVAVVKAHPENPLEDNPDNPLSLVDNEVIAKQNSRVVVSAEPAIQWYIASVEDKSQNTFFKHGTYAIDRVLRPGEIIIP